MLTDAQRGQLVQIWILAADKGGVIEVPDHVELASFIQGVCCMKGDVDLEVLIRLRFISLDAKVTSTRRQGDATLTTAMSAQSRVEKSSTEESTTTAVLEYPCRGNVDTWTLRQPQIDRWASVLPSTDVLGECMKALAWVEANETRRKKPRGMPKFLFGWLNRSTPQPGAAAKSEEPKDCTCGDAYLNSFNRRCLECDGKPSPAQLDAVLEP